MDSFIETFHIDWKIIIAQSINFVVVLFVLYFLLIKPLKKLMKEREEKILKGITDAKDNAEIIEKTKKEYNLIINNARAEAHNLFQEGKREAEIKKKEMLESAQKDVSNMIENGKKTLENEKAKMIEEAKKEIVSLVVSATEKILEDAPDKLNEKTINQIKNM